MVLRRLHDLRHDDEDLYDLEKDMAGPIAAAGYEAPEYPSGLCLTLDIDDVNKAAGGSVEPGDTLHFSAMGEVVSIYKTEDECRIQVRINEFGGHDGKLSDVKTPGAISLTHRELEKMDLDDDCERGDTIHLVGCACVRSCSSNEFMGDTYDLQIEQLAFEDESEEAREG